MGPLDGARLRKLRELKGLRTQADLGQRVGVSQSHISDLEKGKLRNQEVFVRVADELECTTDFLFRRGPFRSAEKPAQFREAASRMAFDLFSESLEVRQIDKDRCRRALGHEDAPLTVAGWKTLSELVDRAIGPDLRPKMRRVGN